MELKPQPMHYSKVGCSSFTEFLGNSFHNISGINNALRVGSSQNLFCFAQGIDSIPFWELRYPLPFGTVEDDFRCCKVGCIIGFLGGEVLYISYPLDA